MKITHYLNKYNEQYGIVDYGDQFQQLLDGRLDTTEAARIWTAIASGEADVAETLIWAQHIAKQVTEQVMNCRRRDRGPAALKAIGFWGAIDVDRDAKAFLQTYSEFFCIDDDVGNDSRKRMTGKQWVAVLRGFGHLKGVHEKTAINKVNAWCKELGI